MCRPPPTAAVQAALDPTVTVTAIQGSPSLRLQRTYSVFLSDGRTLQLVLPPPSALRLLRFERSVIESEIAAVRWIREACLAAGIGGKEKDVLSEVVPGLEGASSELPNPLEAPHLFLSPNRGTPVALTQKPISTLERRRIDRQVGGLMRRLAGVSSPTGKFGPLAAVVPAAGVEPRSQAQPLGIGGAVGGGGAESWSAAFQSMLEGILRDGEDMAVTVPYVTVRRTFRRLGYVLDGVTVPRLVAVDGGEDVNILIETRDSEESRIAGDDTQEETKTGPVVTGLQDWSNCLFGDPLVATVFSDRPSDGFLEGFNGHEADPTAAEVGATGLRLSRDVISDLEASGVRLLLYQMYHALVCVVREFYRPRVDSSKRELAARKRLNEVLVKLGEVRDDPKRSHKRPSGETSPAKRVKQVEDGKQLETQDRAEGNTRGIDGSV